jgi:hypothetical protein
MVLYKYKTIYRDACQRCPQRNRAAERRRSTLIGTRSGCFRGMHFLGDIELSDFRPFPSFLKPP